jgi:hypothetical protein
VDRTVAIKPEQQIARSYCHSYSKVGSNYKNSRLSKVERRPVNDQRSALMSQKRSKKKRQQTTVTWWQVAIKPGLI